MSLLNDYHHRPRMPSPQPSYARHMTAAINIPSGRGSPIPTSAYRNGSLQSTPEGMIPFASSSLPAVPSYTLPEALLGPPPTSSPSAMAEALGKGPGLIRRVSRGAQGIPNRFRRGQSAAQRDKSSGPVIMRRRSDSRTAVDGDTGLSDFDTFEEEDAVDDFFGEPPANGLGITSTPHSVSSIPDHRVVAPVRNARLEQGTVLKKVTRKDKKDINLRLDLESAKVFWDPSKPSKAFYIDDVKEIRAGLEAKHYREECGVSENYAPYWFTIVYTDTTRTKGRIRTMHLIAPDVGIFNMWTHTLESVSRNRIDMMASLLSVADKSARLVWQRAMNKRDNNEESLDFRGIVELCRNLHINCTEATIRDHFSKADTTSSGKLNKAQFLAFVARLKERKDVKAIFKSLTGGLKEMDRPTFDLFLLQEQGVDVIEDPEYWMNTFEKYARSTRSKATPTEGGEIPLPLTMNFSAFQSFLASSANSVLKAVGTAPRLDRPLNEYFISSSHNTYLLGRQVAGESSTEAYITALQKGCRCVEIDCWDGNDDKPVVMHGRTLTKSISFLDTIKAINRYAFTASPYPLILSLEVHCSAPQQIIMVELMRKEFGDKLVCQPLDFESFALPTPEELKNKVLIKVKGASDNQLDSRALMNELSSKRTRSFSSPWSRPVQLNDNIIPNSPLLSSPPSMSPPERTGAFWATPRTSTTSTNITSPTPIASSAVVSSAEDSDSPHVTAAEGPRKQPKKVKTSNITKELGVLGVYTRGVKFTDFNCTDANTFNHVFSINERAFEKITKPGAKDKHLLEEHNIRCLMRVYPHAFRINSSNFDPLKFWRRGVQMVALNWQTYDLGQQLNEAMFASGNDRTGYVLKPSALRHGMHSSNFGHVKAPKKEVKFTVQIISAQQLPRPRGLGPDANINPYVEFEMYCAEDVGANATGIGGQDASAPNGHSGIGNPLRKRTRIVEGNGYNPEFGNEIEMKVTTRYPSLVFVRWTVWNSLDARTTNHAPLAIFTAKLNSIQQGFRHLPLYDSNGEQYLFSTLFCKIKKQDIIDAPEAPPQRTGSRRSSFGAASPLLEPMNPKGSRNFVKRLISRAPSERRRRQDERTGSESRESDLDFISRASTLER